MYNGAKKAGAFTVNYETPDVLNGRIRIGEAHE
jgi:hypothetical protein